MTRSAGPQWTRRKLLEQMVLGSRQTPWVGSAERLAEQLIVWTEQTGISGFNLSRTVVPECFDDVAQMLVPILQDRGLFRRDYEGTTLRENLGLPVPENRHTAARHELTAVAV